jgi:hypothetical protein
MVETERYTVGVVLVWEICSATVSSAATENAFAFVLFATIVPAVETVMLTAIEVAAPAPVPTPCQRVAVIVSLVAEAEMTPDMCIVVNAQLAGITMYCWLNDDANPLVVIPSIG